MPDIEALAWGVVLDAWILQGGLIAFAGVLPAEVCSFLAKRNPSNATFFYLRKLFSLGVALLCLSSAPLLLDTYILEAKGAAGLQKKECMGVLQDSTKSIRVTCGSTLPWDVPLIQAEKVGTGTLYYLGVTKTAVAFGH